MASGLKDAGQLDFDLKLIKGGMIDIEFLAQIAQLIRPNENWGQRDVAGVLSHASKIGLFTGDEAELLKKTYHDMQVTLSLQRVAFDGPAKPEDWPVVLKGRAARALSYENFDALCAAIGQAKMTSGTFSVKKYSLARRSEIVRSKGQQGLETLELSTGVTPMKKTLMTMTLMTSALAVGFGAVAVAQDAPMKRERGGFDRGHGPFPMMMDKLDLNSDGEITAEEIEAHDAAMFAEMDADGDGVVTGAEMTAHHDAKREEMRRKMEERRQAKMIEHLDQDGDGVISLMNSPAARSVASTWPTPMVMA